MKHLQDILNESLLDDNLETTTDIAVTKRWAEQYVKCDGKIMFLKNGTIKFTGDTLIKGFDGEALPSSFIVSEVNGDFKIEKCNNIKNINGLFKAYSDVNGDFVISNCPKIESVMGGPMTVKGNLSFTGNKSLKNLEGMPMFVYETIYIMKNGKRFTEKDVQKYVQVPQRVVCSIEEEVNESIVNEALNEPHLLELVKQIKNNNGTVRDYLQPMSIELDQLDSSNVKEFTKVDTKAVKAASEIVRGVGTDTSGFVILVNHNNEYVAIIDNNKFCKPVKKGWTPMGYYSFSGGILSYTECMNNIKNSYSIIVVKWDFETKNNFYTKRADRSASKEGMILNTARQNEEIARANRERYIKLAAQMKAQRDKDFEKIDEEVEKVINEVLKVSQKAKRNPEKYDSFQVKRLNALIYGEQQWVGFKSSKSGYSGEDGLLVIYARFTESYMDVVKDGGGNYDRTNIDKLKTLIKEKLDKIKNRLKDFA